MPAAEAAITAATNVLTNTLPNRQKQVMDQWDNQHVGLFFLNRMGGIKSYDGGASIQFPIATDRSSTVATRGVNASVPLTKKETKRLAEFVATTLTDAIVLNFFEMDENAGVAKIIDAWDEEQRLVLKSVQDEFNIQMLAASGVGDDFDGLPVAVSATPTTGTYGGIDRALAANAFWRNGLEAAVGSFAAGGLAALRALNVTVNKGSTQHLTSFNITTGLVYNAFEATQEPNVRYRGPLGDEAADAGFRVLEWKGMPVAYDNEVPTGNWYMINFDNFFYKRSPSWHFTFAKVIESEGQFQQSQKIANFGQFASNRPNNLGVATGITA